LVLEPWHHGWQRRAEFKDMVNLTFHEFFERRQSLPVEE
jgi:hypothetical protein